MILIDANLLIYAYDRSSRRHERAREWLETTMAGPAPVRLAWPTVMAFLRITTHPGVFERPLTLDEAWEIVEAWFEAPLLDLVLPTERHWRIFRSIAETGQARGPLLMDAHLAALAIEHGARLCSTDRDFTRFPDLDWVNPLE